MYFKNVHWTRLAGGLISVSPIYGMFRIVNVDSNLCELIYEINNRCDVLPFKTVDDAKKKANELFHKWAHNLIAWRKKDI